MSIEALAIALNHSQARGAAKLVLIGIANHLGPDADEGAWPSQARLASYANVSDRAVRDAIEALVALGEVRVEVAGGNSRNQYKPNRYWITLRCPASCDHTLGHNRVEVSSNQGGSFPQSGWKPASDEPLRETEKKQVNAHFEEFWNAYPRKLDKAKAFRAFKSALSRATYEDIMAGVIAYRNDPTRNPDFTKYPATWLNADSWENAATPSPDSEAAERNRARRDRELEASRTYLAELKEQEAQASAPATCPHGKTLALCLPCSREINA